MNNLTEFGAALKMARTAAGLSQRAVGEAIGLSQSAYNTYEVGSQEPSRETVFLLEEVLDLAPGALSRHLGYLPVAWERKKRLTFEEFIQVEEKTLTSSQRAMLVQLYRELTGAERPRRG